MYSYTKKFVFDEGQIISVQFGNGINGIDEHTHEFLEFIYILEGSGCHVIDGMAYEVNCGDLLFVNFGQTHSFKKSPDMRFVNILLDPSFMSKELLDSDNIANLFQSSLFEEFYEINCDYSRQCVSFEGEEKEDNDRLVATMLDEFKSRRTGYQSVLHGCVRILFTRLLRKLSVYSDELSPSVSEENRIIREIVDYIDENCSEKISLEELASRSFYNPSYFGRLLKRYFGKSFTQYIKEKRIANAAFNLEHSEHTVEAVMELAGYSDKKLFYKHFREIYGMTPKEYRQSRK